MEATIIMGAGKVSVDSELNLHLPSKTISKAEMLEMSESFKGVNRIHKPMALLFWIDVKNGNSKNWTLV